MLKQKNLNILNQIKTGFERLRHVDVGELTAKEITNPFQLFLVWLLEIIQYGALAVIVLNSMFGWLGWKNLALLAGIGVFRWLLLDTVKEISKAIRGNN